MDEVFKTVINFFDAIIFNRAARWIAERPLIFSSPCSVLLSLCRFTFVEQVVFWLNIQKVHLLARTIGRFLFQHRFASLQTSSSRSLTRFCFSISTRLICYSTFSASSSSIRLRFKMLKMVLVSYLSFSCTSSLIVELQSIHHLEQWCQFGQTTQHSSFNASWKQT